ncbi:hypothetical protein A8709_01545 [Paenibacillus pectinilyticus]|uniref:Phosphatidylglycerol lysyltransferase n=1 Tax=Paenibacillus pectinilyticus TaxID=512399 RepID=A0A1C1A6G8_9BACL|nr:lysylphosphatidylglycerol synthase domain-containing protein [Paenibacillus pectinilyticus]OCT16157.1 hypothetical protein A8709_01545 [Paenibacillus pectinilyticus]
MIPKWLLTTLKTILVAVIVYFALRSLPLRAVDLVAFLKRADYRFYLSMVLFAVFLMLQASIWVLIVNTVHVKDVESDNRTKLGLLSGLRIFIDSQFAKYIPGGIWNYAGRVVLATRAGVSLAAQFAAILYENILLVSAALSYALLLAMDLGVTPSPILLSIMLAVAACGYVYYARMTSWISRVVGGASRWKWMKKLLDRITKSDEAVPNRDSAYTLTRNQFFGYLACFLGSHFVMGIAFWMLTASFDAGHISVLYAAGTFATAWLLGLLSPLPGGLGLREGFLVYFLSMKLGTSAALQISIIARLWNMMAEVTFWALIQSVSRLARRVRGYES